MTTDKEHPVQPSLPVKSIDPGQDVSERVSDNVRKKIGPSRYFQPGETSWEDVFDRVAGNVALATLAHRRDVDELTEENAHAFEARDDFIASLPDRAQAEYEKCRDEYYDAMAELRFVPNTPTLTSAGTELQMLSACIAGHSPVYTKDGLTRMDEISPGDKVLTHEGRFRKVTDHWSNGERDTIEMKRGPSSRHHYDCVVTPDHEILNRDGEWVRADELESPAGPVLPDTEPFPAEISLSRYTAQLSDRKQKKEITVESGNIKLRNYSDYSDRDFDGQVSQPTAFIDNNPDLAWVIGLYLAEGDIYGTDVRFTLGSDESTIADRLIRTVDELFDLPVSISESNHGNWTQYRISSAFVADFFATICGTGVTEKRLPEWVGRAPEEYHQALFDGLISGDGHYDGNGDKVALANPTLVYELTLLSRTIGYECVFKLDASRELSANDTSECYISHSDRSRLRSASKQSGDTVEVYDMAVEEDHSFVVGDFIVHNCFVNSPTDSMEDIFETTKEWGLTEKAGGGMGGAFYNLRPKGAPVGTTGGVSSGPMEFIRLYNATGHTIKQGGVRSGAQMAVMHAHHPDVGRFCTAKRGDDDLTCFNISVGVTDDFLNAVAADDTYVLESPETGDLGFDADAFDVVPETAHFYDPQFEDAWNDEYDKPGIGHDGKVVEENFWRDHYDNMSDPSRFDQYRDRIDVEPGEPMELPARFVWELIVDGAYNNGEPGVLHMDRAEDEHSFDVTEAGMEYHQYATNPCVRKGTLVNTPDGYRPVEDIDVGDEISTIRGSETVDDVEVFVDRDTYRVRFSDGGEQYVTPDHRYHAVRDGDYTKRVDDIPVRDLDVGDKVRVHERHPVEFDGNEDDYKYGLRQGILLGDGSYTEAQLEQHDRVKIASSQADDGYNEQVPSLFDDYRFGEPDTSNRSKSMNHIILDGKDVVEDHDLTPAKSPEKEFDDTSIRNEMHALGLIDGLIATDGNINLSSNHPQARYDTTSEDLADTFRRACWMIGCHGRVTFTDDKSNGVIDGRQIKSDSTRYTGHLSGRSLRQYLAHSRLGDIHPSKGERLDIALDEYRLTGNSWMAEIIEIEKDGSDRVYDLYCSGSDTWITSGYVQRGCAEQFLGEYEACNLGHVNLSLMVDDNRHLWDEWRPAHWTGPGKQDVDNIIEQYVDHAIDTELLESTVRTGTRFLDDVITMNDFPLDRIEERVDELRKIGVGVMGFHQMLLQLGVEYGSDASVQIGKEIMRRIDQIATDESHRLAKERGVFGAWDDSKWSEPMEYPAWFERHGHDTPYKWPQGYPVRNHNVTTVAPTGTTGRIGDTSLSIEPIYSVAFFSNVSDDIQGEEMLVDFDDYFLDTIEANGIDVDTVKEEAKSLMLDNSFDGPESLESVPDEIASVFVTTSDVDPEEHVDILTAFQQHVDSSISKTCNLPNDSDHDDVDGIFRKALNEGAKSVTVYRDGSRNEQVLTTRVDNGLDGDHPIDELVELLVDAAEHLSIDTEYQLRKETGVKPDPGNAERTCDECGSGTLDLSEGCAVCVECGASPCQ